MNDERGTFKEVHRSGFGVRLLCMAGAVIRAVYVTRAAESLSLVNELRRTGVYVLLRITDEPGSTRAYVGLAGPGMLWKRLKQHRKERDWWTHALGFTRLDERLSGEDVLYLEDRLHDLMRQSERFLLENEAPTRRPAIPCAFRLADLDALVEQIGAFMEYSGVPMTPRRLGKSEWCDSIFRYAMAFVSAVGGTTTNHALWDALHKHVAGTLVSVPSNQLERSTKAQYPSRLVHNFQFALCRARSCGIVVPADGTGPAGTIALTDRGHRMAAEWRRELGWPSVTL